MRVLLDECVPQRFRHALVADVSTVGEMGWQGVKNGELLRRMEAAGFDVLLTVDRNIKSQQNLAASSVALVVVIAVTNRIADLLPLAPSINGCLAAVQPGTVTEITA